jgi:MFS family permease
VLLGLLAGGLLLQWASPQAARYAFAAMFSVACVSRLISTRLQAAQSEPVPMPPDHRRVGWRELLGRLSHGSDARLLAYMIAMQITINLAQPFFIPYALQEMHVGYASYFLLIAAPYAARMLAFPMFGQIAHRVGARWLLWIGGIGLLPISGLWMVSGATWYLLLVQFIAGVAWAAYELGTFLMVWETVAEGERTSIMTTFNLLNSGANAGGALLGGQLLTAMGAGLGGYHMVFGLSLAARLATVILLIRLHQMVTRAAAAKPAMASAAEVAAAPGTGARTAASEAGARRSSSHRRPAGDRRGPRLHSARRSPGA